MFGLDASRVTDRAGNPISGTAPDGDFVLQLSIDPPVLPQVDQEPNNFPSLAQNLGPLYVRELRPGVQVDGSVAVGGGDQDYYRFEVTRAGFFSFRLEPGAGASSTGLLRLHDAMGMQLAQGFRLPGMGSVLYRFLKPGEYIIQMDGAVGVPGESYVLRIQAASDPEIPLVDQNLNPRRGRRSSQCPPPGPS